MIKDGDKTPLPLEGQGEAQEWYLKGNDARRQSQWHEAINCYTRAIELDPDSPAVVAKKMLEDIMNYYCKEMYNP